MKRPTKNLTVAVREEDLANAWIILSQNTTLGHVACPVALATRRLFPHSEITVSHTTVNIGDHCYALPTPAIDWLHRFDRIVNRAVQLGLRRKPMLPEPLTFTMTKI